MGINSARKRVQISRMNDPETFAQGITDETKTEAELLAQDLAEKELNTTPSNSEM